jgi:glutamate-ammonia-ligase adenylyltransferase
MNQSHKKLIEGALEQGTDAKDLAVLFSELRFDDPAKAAALWRKLIPSQTPELLSPEIAATLLDELASSADPDMALLNLTSFVKATITPTQFLHSVFLARPICRLLATLFSCSYYLTDILAQNPGYLSWLIEERTLEGTKAHSAYRSELIRQIEPFQDPRRRLNSVKRYLRRELLRIGARDLMGLAAVEEVTAELSFLADAIIETVSSMAFEELAEREGPGPTAWSFEKAVPFHRFAVISLGKLGGTELNYSSDIDLLYVCDVTEGERESAFYTALARRVTELLSSATEEGALYRVDLRLRPDGDSGPIVVTLADHLNYLQRRAKPWEKQALLKARASAGNRPVADAFIANCAQSIFGAAGGMDPLEEILTMRERSIASRSPEERASDIKLMSGGIRDIEFIVQALELVHGKSRPEVRSRNTLEALERLGHSGLLSVDVRETLERGYRLFRTVEHRLQMLRNVRTHRLPADLGELEKTGARVARSSLRGITPENFRAELSRSVVEVQHIFNDFFKERTHDAAALLLSLPAEDEAVEEILAAYGIREGERAHRFLSSLVFGDFPQLEGPETLAAAVKSLPGILEHVSRTPDPSLTTKNLVRIAKASGAVKATLDLLGGGGDLLRLFLAVAALSTNLSETLARRIELLDVLAEGVPPGEPPRPAGAAGDVSPRSPRTEGDLSPRPGRSHGDSSARLERSREDLPGRLGRWYEESQLFIHCQNPIPERGPETIGPLLASAAEEALRALFADAAKDARALALFAAGSLGTRGMRFGSDLDLVAVTMDEATAATETDMMRRLLDNARRARLGQVDMRLRGEGEGSPLVQTLDYYESYLESRAHLWEMLAFEKCRFLCGDPSTGTAFEEMLRRTLPAVFTRTGWKERLLDARAKLESLSKSAWDVKHAAGGLYDIDFMLSTAHLLGITEGSRSGDRSRRLEPPSADRSGGFDRIIAAGLLRENDSKTLVAAHRLFWTIEHAAALHEIPYPPSPEREEFFERYFSRLFGERMPGDGTFLVRLEAEKERVRSLYHRFFETIS